MQVEKGSSVLLGRVANLHHNKMHVFGFWKERPHNVTGSLAFAVPNLGKWRKVPRKWTKNHGRPSGLDCICLWVLDCDVVAVVNGENRGKERRSKDGKSRPESTCGDVLKTKASGPVNEYSNKYPVCPSRLHVSISLVESTEIAICI